MTKQLRTRSLSCITFAALAVMAVVTTGWSTPAQEQERRVARTHQGSGGIVQLAGAHPEEVIEVIYGFTPHTMDPPDGKSRLDYLTDVAPNILLVDVVAKSSRINIDGTWIVTDVTARVVESIKSDGLVNAGPGTEVTFVEQGGEVEVGSKTIRGIVPWALRYEIGSQYLLFFQVAPNGALKVTPTSSFERVIDGGFRTMRTGAHAEVTEDSAAEVLTAVRRRRAGGGS